MTEPTTFFSDLVLAMVMAACGIALKRSHWRTLFFFGALGALLGGTFHGFREAMGPVAATILWRATTISLGVASYGLALAAAKELPVKWHRPVALAALIKVSLFALWMLGHDAFIYVVVDYGLAMLFALTVYAPRLRGRVDAQWIVAGIGGSLLAAIIQRSRLVVGPLNHNDLYHFAQIVANIALFIGARHSLAGEKGRNGEVTAESSGEESLAAGKRA
jgi:hypothetical protein